MRVRAAGDTVWIYPDQHELEGHPRGFGFFISYVHGAAEPRNPYSDKILTTGFIFDERIGNWKREPVPLVISRRQPLVQWGQASPEERRVATRHRVDDRDRVQEPSDMVQHEGRTYVRLRVSS